MNIVGIGQNEYSAWVAFNLPGADPAGYDYVINVFWKTCKVYLDCEEPSTALKFDSIDSAAEYATKLAKEFLRKKE